MPPFDAASTIALFQQIEKTNPDAGRIVVICDNARYYRSKAVQEYLATSRIQLEFLPAYSPDFNPIEMMWRRSKPCCGRAQAPGRRASVNSGGSGASAAKACLRPPNSYSKRVESECRKRRFAP